MPTENVANVGGEKFLRSLTDSPITITGKIEFYKGKPEIVISSPAQITDTPDPRIVQQRDLLGVAKAIDE